MISASLALGASTAPHLATRVEPQRLDEPWPPHVPIRLCALRVDFQRDSVSGTTGDGSFGSGLPDTLRIDPRPHHRAYFENHLKFLEDYFVTASRGAVSFADVDVFPQVDTLAYTLPFPMWHYNYNSDTALLNDRLVELFAQAVNLAADNGVNFAQYDAVIVFHAGVGKDFNIGFDTTPFDIPSAYISESDLSAFPGSLPDSVTRGIILPESQNQVETLEFGVELSLNGVMIKLFGNWLGMPDLYNTETGASGIGRWGMMDQGSGNVNAIVPALPDAWSRLYMKWDTAQVVFPAGLGDTVQIARFNVGGAPRIVKIAVTQSEYYLIENRHAFTDSGEYVSVFDSAGREMRIDRDGNLTVEENFYVAESASHYDFGIPGSGLLIWHIDEQVIRNKIAENRVNADPELRGVDLVEADGSQDIGREYGFASSGSGTELGIQEDCWYRDNRAFREANGGSIYVRFNDNTRPSARLNSHAYTFLEISEFSDVDSIMSCRIRGTAVEKGFPVVVSDVNAVWAAADLDTDGRREVYIQSHDTLYVVRDSTGLNHVSVLPAGVRLLPEPGWEEPGETYSSLLFVGGMLGRFALTDGAPDSLFRELPWQGAEISFIHRAGDSQSAVSFVVHGAIEDEESPQGFIALLDSNFNVRDSVFVNSRFFIALEPAPANDYLLIDNESIRALVVSDDSLVVRWSAVAPNVVTGPEVVISPEQTTIYLQNVGYLDARTGELLCDAQTCSRPQVDWDGDGQPDGGYLDGADHAPREDFALDYLAHNEVFDVNFDGEPDVLRSFAVTDANLDTIGHEVIAYDHHTRRYPDFPLALPGSPEALRISEVDLRFYLLTRSELGSGVALSLVKLPVSPDGTTLEYYTARNNLILVGPPRPQVHDRDPIAYVWPNPARDAAHIRVTLPYAANADVRVFDLVGREVARLSASSSHAGAFDIPWTTRDVQSGVYLARVTTDGGGESLSAEVKIAVVR